MTAYRQFLYLSVSSCSRRLAPLELGPLRWTGVVVEPLFLRIPRCWAPLPDPTTLSHFSSPAIPRPCSHHAALGGPNLAKVPPPNAFVPDLRSPRSLTTAADCTRENRSRGAVGSPQPRTTPPTARSHSSRLARGHGAKKRGRGQTRGLEVPQETVDGRGLHPRDSVSGRCRITAASRNTPDGALPQSLSSAPAPHKNKGKRIR